MAAIDDLIHMQSLGLYEELEMQIGRQEAHCIALERWNGKRDRRCHPEGFMGWFAYTMSMECGP